MPVIVPMGQIEIADIAGAQYQHITHNINTVLSGDQQDSLQFTTFQMYPETKHTKSNNGPHVGETHTAFHVCVG